MARSETTTTNRREKVVSLVKEAWVGWTFGLCVLGVLLGREFARPAASSSGMPCVLSAEDLSRGEAAVLERLENDIASWRMKSVETASVLQELYAEMERVRKAAEEGGGGEDERDSSAADEAVAATEQIRSFSEAAEARLKAIEAQAAETRTVLLEAADAQRKKLLDIETAAIERAREAVDSATSSSSSSDEKSNLDDLRTLVDEAARRYIEGDRVGEFDYALAAAGAKVVASLSSEPYTPPDRIVPTWLWHAVGRDAGVGRAEDAIDAKMTFGSCFAFRGSWGNLTVQTATGPVRPKSFTVEHIHGALCNPVHNRNCSSAPRNFHVLGRTTLDEDGDPPTLLGRFRYDAMMNKPALQRFEVDPSLYRASDPNAVAFPYVTLDVKDNHGHANYTCIYRFRVHGEHASR